MRIRRTNRSRSILRAATAAVVAVPLSATAATVPLPIYDGLNYNTTGTPPLGTGPSNNGGTLGQWVYQGNNTTEPRMSAGSLSYPGLPPSVGNKVQLDNAGGPPNATGADASRLFLGTINKADAPTLYYSYILNVPTSNATAIPFFAGFDNSINATYNSFGATFIQKDSTNTSMYDLGIGTSGIANRAFTGPLAPGTSVFVVGSFTFQGLANLDVYSDPASVPTAEPAPGSHSATSLGVDASASTTISNFYVRGNNGEMQGIQIDEVRIGTSWSDVAAKGYYWDIDGSNPGSGGATPSGNWDGTTNNFNSDPTGGGAGALVATATRGDTLLFSAGSDATGSYAVTVSGTQKAGTVSVKNGAVSFSGGALTVGRFDIASGASATVASSNNGAETTGAIIKSGDGNVTFSAASTYAGGTTLSAGGLGIGIDSVGAGAGTTSGALGTGPVTISPGFNATPSFFADGGPHTLGNNIIMAGSPLIVSGTNDLTLAGDISLGNGNRGLRIDNGQTNFTGVISGTTGIVKTGTGTAVLSGANTYSGTTSIFAGVLSVSSAGNLGDGSGTNSILLNGGTLRATGPVSSVFRSVTINVSSTVDAGDSIALGDVSGTAGLTKTGSGTLTINSFRAPNLTINGGRLQLAANGQAAGVSVLNTLSIPAAGQLDISDNHLVDHADSVASVTALITSGRNGGGWTGNGIVTSQSTALAGSLTTIGVATAQQVKGLANPTDTATFAGQTVTGTDTLVMYTYGGDANLDGKINVDDYGHIDTSIPLGLTGWYNGDFNYDGKINVDDYGIIDFNIGIQGAPFFTSGGAGLAAVSAVPEPASLSVIAAGLALLSRRLRRRT